MSNRLDKTFTGRKYLIIESCLDHNASKLNIENKVDSAINDLYSLPFINKEIISTTYNWEKYVYPIQTLENRINLKDIQSYISEKAKNIESLGTSADFAYNDIQVIFKKAMELSLDIKESNNFNLSKIHFNKLIDKEERENLFIKNNMNDKDFSEILINTYKNPQKCKIIAEIGINHNGSISQLYKLCELACKSGADIVKVSIF